MCSGRKNLTSLAQVPESDGWVCGGTRDVELRICRMKIGVTMTTETPQLTLGPFSRFELI